MSFKDYHQFYNVKKIKVLHFERTSLDKYFVKSTSFAKKSVILTRSRISVKLDIVSRRQSILKEMNVSGAISILHAIKGNRRLNRGTMRVVNHLDSVPFVG